MFYNEVCFQWGTVILQILTIFQTTSEFFTITSLHLNGDMGLDCKPLHKGYQS